MEDALIIILDGANMKFHFIIGINNIPPRGTEKLVVLPEQTKSLHHLTYHVNLLWFPVWTQTMFM